MDVTPSGRPAASASPVRDVLVRGEPVSNLAPCARKIGAGEALPGFAASFPISDLTALDGKGPLGNSFILSSGSVDGLEVSARRLQMQDQPAIEINFKVTPARIASLAAALETAGAHPQALRFHAAQTGPDDLTRQVDGGATLLYDNARDTSAPDIEKDARRWGLALDGAHGSQMELGTASAAYTVRGLVRITLKGSDAECTKQLQRFVKLAGLEAELAPSTADALERVKLMSVLWQADHKAAEALAADGPEKVSLNELKARLKALGYDDQRLANVHLEEVCPGHFTAVDAAQGRELVAAGARYLYATVFTPEGVCGILQNGQKCSLRRYQEGLIVNGMSTITDFCTGGASTVMVRLVTDKAIADNLAWSPGYYVVALTPDLLSRTDWYGWAKDDFGSAWNLTTTENFGRGLVGGLEKSYVMNNEIALRTGTRPDDITGVFATDDRRRLQLIAALRARGFVPPDGKSLEQFVTVTERLAPLGKPPLDVADLDALRTQALDEAKAGDDAKLRSFLRFGPGLLGADRAGFAKLEEDLLRSPKETLRGAALSALAARGEFLMDAGHVEALLDELWAGAPDQQKIASALMVKGLCPLLKLDRDSITARLPPRNEFPADRFTSDDWLDVCATLLPKQTPSSIPSPSLARAFAGGLDKLLEKRPLALGALCEKTALPKLDAAGLDRALADFAKTGDTGLLSLVVLHAPSAIDAGKLIEQVGRKCPDAAVRLLAISYGKFQSLGLQPPQLVSLAVACSSGYQYMLWRSCGEALLATKDASLLPAIYLAASSQVLTDRQVAQAAFSELDGKTGMLPPYTLRLLSALIARLATGIAPESEALDVMTKLRALPLYEVKDLDAFVKEAACLAQSGEADKAMEGDLRLAWLASGPTSLAVAWPDLFASLASAVPFTDRLRWVETAALAMRPSGTASLEECNRLAQLYLKLDSTGSANASIVLESLTDDVIFCKSPEICAKLAARATDLYGHLSTPVLTRALKYHKAQGDPDSRAMLSMLAQKFCGPHIRIHRSPYVGALAQAGLTPAEAGIGADAACRILQHGAAGTVMDCTQNVEGVKPLASVPELMWFLLDENGQVDKDRLGLLLDTVVGTAADVKARQDVMDAVIALLPDELKVTALRARRKIEQPAAT